MSGIANRLRGLWYIVTGQYERAVIVCGSLMGWRLELEGDRESKLVTRLSLVYETE